MSSFRVLLYHEMIRREDATKEPFSPICVQQNYEDRLPKVLFTYLDDFEKQMAYLYEEGFHTLTLSEVYDYYYNKGSIPEKSVLLTFDDMYLSVYRYAYPILQKYHFHAVGFVVLGWLFKEGMPYQSNQSVCMSFKEIDSMRDVFEYANHTNKMHTKHFDEEGKIETQFVTTEKDELFKDLTSCESFVDYKGAFAYPFGGYTQQQVDWLQQEGYTLAFTCETGLNNKETLPLELRRDVVAIGTPLDGFKKLLKGEETR